MYVPHRQRLRTPDATLAATPPPAHYAIRRIPPRARHRRCDIDRFWTDSQGFTVILPSLEGYTGMKVVVDITRMMVFRRKA